MEITLFEWAALASGGSLVLGGIGVIALHVMSAWIRLRGQWQHQQLEKELLQREIAAEHKRFARWIPLEHAWEGFRKFEVSQVHRECPNVTSLYLVPHDKRELPLFHPGQFLTFGLRIPGRDRQLIRCYSLSDRPRNDYYRITVKKIPPPPSKPEAPSGLSSSYINDDVAEGDILDVKAPSGDFYLDMGRDRPAVLLAGGIGITPLLSMLLSVAESDSQREVWMFYGVTNSSEHVKKAELRELAEQHPNIHLRVAHTKPLPDDVLGQDYDLVGFISLELLKSSLPSNNYDFYIVGPPPMMSAITSALAEWGVPRERVHFEAFGPASVKQASPPVKPEQTEVEFARSDQSGSWDGSYTSLLELGEALGIPLNSGCRSGNCGECETAIRSGKVKYLREPSYRPEGGSCLTCISVPDGPLTLDA